MAKRTISFGDYEEPTWEEYTGEDPPANKWFNAALTKVKFLAEDDQLMFIFEITEGDFKGWGKSIYAPFEGERKFAMHQTLKALQGGKMTDVTVDWENEKAVAAWVAKQKPVKLKTREYNGSTLIAKVAPLLELAGAPKASAKAELAPDPEVVADDEPIEDYTAEELAEMSVEDLVEVLTEEFEYTEEDLPEKKAGRGAAAKYKQALVEAVLEAQEEGDEEDEDADEADSEDEDEDGFEDGFEEEESEPEPEPEPEPAPRARRSRAAKAAPAKATPPAKAAPAATTRRRRS